MARLTRGEGALAGAADFVAGGSFRTHLADIPRRRYGSGCRRWFRLRVVFIRVCDVSLGENVGRLRRWSFLLRLFFVTRRRSRRNFGDELLYFFAARKWVEIYIRRRSISRRGATRGTDVLEVRETGFFADCETVVVVESCNAGG